MSSFLRSPATAQQQPQHYHHPPQHEQRLSQVLQHLHLPSPHISNTAVSTAAPTARLPPSAKLVACPACGDLVAREDLEEHLRTELLDPTWKQRRQGNSNTMTGRLATHPTSANTHSLPPTLHTALVSPSSPHRSLRRAVIVTGARTPFCKSFTSLTSVDSIGLAVAAVGGLITAAKLDPQQIDSLIIGNVVLTTSAPNIAREVILDLHLPVTIPGLSISIACLSGLEAVALAVQQIETGQASVVIAGGSDSTTNAEMPLPRPLTVALGAYQLGGGNKKGWSGYIELLRNAGAPWTWIPSAPSITERSTKKTMGYHADLMAEINHISREAQDAFAVESHRKAAAARSAGKFNDVVPVTNKQGKTITQDNLIRDKMEISKLATLPPAFRPPPAGTITAASSSALTDGASAVLVMHEQKAQELGYATDISLRAYVRCAFDPFPQLLLAPALALPACLHKAGLTLDEIDLFEIHEAFAGQVLATLSVLQDADFYEKYTGKRQAVGKIDPQKINVNGGSLALGHPFAATGGRLVTNAMNELRRTGKRFALISICAAGGIGGVAIIEHTPRKHLDTQA